MYGYTKADAALIKRLAQRERARSPYSIPELYPNTQAVGKHAKLNLPIMNGLTIFIVIPTSTIPAAVFSGGVWVLGEGTATIQQRQGTEEDTQDPTATVTGFDLSDHIDLDTSAAVDVRVFNATSSAIDPGTPGKPYIAVQDMFGDLYIIAPGTSSSTPTGVPFFNAGSEAIPAFGPMEVVGITTIGGSHYAEVVRAGLTGNFNTLWLVNRSAAVPVASGPTDTDATSRGDWLTENPGTVLVADLANIPYIDAGVELGIRPSSLDWGAWADAPGFTALGQPYLYLGNYVVDVRQRVVDQVYGKAYNTVTQNNYGNATIDFEIWYRGSGSGIRTPAGWNRLTAYLPFLNKDDRVSAGTWGTANWFSSTWEADFACDPDNTNSSQQSPGANQSTTFTFQGSPTSDSTQYAAGSLGTGIGTK